MLESWTAPALWVDPGIDRLTGKLGYHWTYRDKGMKLRQKAGRQGHRREPRGLCVCVCVGGEGCRWRGNRKGCALEGEGEIEKVRVREIDRK